MPRRWYSYGPDVTAWIEANCVLPLGEHIGRPFRLTPWQKDWINTLPLQPVRHPEEEREVVEDRRARPLPPDADPYEADPWAVCARPPTGRPTSSSKQPS
jgi:hypothetical protein